MYKIKISTLVLSLVISGNLLFAQSIDEGKKFLYYEKYNSAKDVFSKLVNSNANNIDAVYWLGQTHLDLEDTASAKALYQKTLQANPNAPLLVVGMGEIELLENKPNDARNRFETAISLSKGKDANVLNAVGKANIDAKGGDSLYAIEKLKLAAERDKKNPEILVNLGDAYRKIPDGANAQIAYQNALAINQNYARASFMIGRLYETQGISQEQYYMKYYNEAIAKDPNFAPVNFWLYNYYYRRDVNKSREYLNKYIALADPDPKNCYYQASILYASQLFKESIAKSDECIAAAGANPYPNLYGLKAYAFDKLGDSVNAKTFFETYFQKQKLEKFGPNDYATYAKVLLKFPGNDSAAAMYADKAVALDTLESNKVDYISAIAANYVTSKNYKEAANWYNKVLGIKKNIGKIDLYNAAYNYYMADSCKTADSIYGVYVQKYPDELYGYKWRAKSNECIDSTRAQGLANPYYEKVIVLGEADTAKEKVKADLLSAYNYMVAYHYNIKNDKPTALSYVDKILALDPTNAGAIKNKELLTAAVVKQKTKTEATKEKVTPKKTKAKSR
ncbi:MAG: tetratricopeptide repeat protein [Ginsengibacter sp.]